MTNYKEIFEGAKSFGISTAVGAIAVGAIAIDICGAGLKYGFDRVRGKNISDTGHTSERPSLLVRLMGPTP